MLFGHLGIVVSKADGGKAQRHQQHDPDIAIVEPRPEQRPDHQRSKDQQTAHGRRSGLGKMVLRPVITDWLTLLLLAAQQVDQRSAKEKSKEQRSEKGAARPEGDIPEQVEEIPAVGEVREPIKHYAVLS